MKLNDVDVLGTTYSVHCLSVGEDKYLKDRDGYCDKTSKRIVVRMADETNELDNYTVYLNTILRHEIIHAFLFESGLHENWMHPEHGHNETYVDWIAVQFPKLMEAFRQVGCL